MVEKTPWPWWESLWRPCGSLKKGKTLWMSSVLEPHKVTSVLSNLVPMVTAAAPTSIPCHIYQRIQKELQPEALKKNFWQTVAADVHDVVQCVIWIANIVQSRSKVYFGKEECTGVECVTCVYCTGFLDSYVQNRDEQEYLPHLVSNTLLDRWRRENQKWSLWIQNIQ